jgi:biotin carboxyl carrier protein
MKVQIGEQWYAVEMDDIRTNPVRVLVDGVPVEIEVEGLPAAEVTVQPAASGPAASGIEAGTPMGQVTEVRAPMLGVIVSVAVSVGQRVSAGDQLCVLEALKLQQSIRAPTAGVVRAVQVQLGQGVNAGQIIFELR